MPAIPKTHSRSNRSESQGNKILGFAYWTCTTIGHKIEGKIKCISLGGRFSHVSGIESLHFFSYTLEFFFPQKINWIYYLKNTAQGTLWRMRHYQYGKMLKETRANVAPTNQRNATRDNGEILDVLWEEQKGSIDKCICSKRNTHPNLATNRHKT